MADDVSKGVKNPPRSPKSGALLKPFNSVTAKAAQEASVRARNLRKQMRAKILQAAVDEGIDKLFQQAIKKKDKDLLELVEKGLKLTGLDYASSEDAIQKLDIKSDNKTDAKVNIAVTGLDG